MPGAGGSGAVCGASLTRSTHRALSPLSRQTLWGPGGPSVVLGEQEGKRTGRNQTPITGKVGAGEPMTYSKEGGGESRGSRSPGGSAFPGLS